MGKFSCVNFFFLVVVFMSSNAFQQWLPGRGHASTILYAGTLARYTALSRHHVQLTYFLSTILLMCVDVYV